MNVHVLPAGPVQTNAYLLTEPSTGEAVLVDAPGDVWLQVEPLLRRDGARLSEIWLTHGHWDHTQGAAEVIRRTGAKVTAHKDDRAMFETPEVMRAYTFPEIVLEPVKVDRWVGDGDVLRMLGRDVPVSHVPGHSPGSIMFHFADTGAAFSGDILFRGNVGITDVPGGSGELLQKSIRTKLYTLPDATTVYPGHGGPTTVGEEKATNPYVRG